MAGRNSIGVGVGVTIFISLALTVGLLVAFAIYFTKYKDTNQELLKMKQDVSSFVSGVPTVLDVNGDGRDTRNTEVLTIVDGVCIAKACFFKLVGEARVDVADQVQDEPALREVFCAVGIRVRGVEIEDFNEPRLMTAGEHASQMDRFWHASDRIAAAEAGQ